MGTGAEVGKVCQDGNWGLKSRHSASPANSFCSGESNFWQADGARISSTVALAAPLLYPEQHLKQPQARGVSFQVRVHPFSITYGLHLPEVFGGKGSGMPLEGCPNRAAAPDLAQLYLSNGHSSGAAGAVAVPQGDPAAATCGKPQQFWGLSSSFSQM